MFKILVAVAFGAFAFNAASAQKSTEILYVGTFFGTGSQGIYVFTFDRAKGKLTWVQTVQTLESPTFLEIHPSGRFLYAVNRGPVEEMQNSGSVSSFRIDPKTGKLTLLNQRPSYGHGPCHISIDHTGKWAFISNYNEGNFVVMPIFDDGLLGSSSDARRHLEHSVNPERQERPHVHSSIVSPDNRFVIVSDLGTDRIHSYKLDISDGSIEDAQVPYLSVKPGCGPRHFAFHPNGRYAYSAEELTSTVGVMDYDKVTGTLTMRADSVVSLPDGFKGTNLAADIHVHPNGKFLYLSNRGHNAIAIFSIDSSGMIKLVGEQDTKGKIPRNFMIDLKGEYALVANQDSNTIIVFRVDQKTGKLQYVSTAKGVPSPVCLKMLSLK